MSIEEESVGRIQSRDEALAEGCTHLEGMDMVISPNGGHIVVVAQDQGVHVCWGCGEPFEIFGEKSLVEKRMPGAGVPIAMHAGCAFGPRRRYFSLGAALESPETLVKAMAGVNALKGAKRALAGMHRVAAAAAEGAKKIIT